MGNITIIIKENLILCERLSSWDKGVLDGEHSSVVAMSKFYAERIVGARRMKE